MGKPREMLHETDVCIVGGGMAGTCAAIAAARHGVKVILMQDRPVLGGNASSEIRVNICGALGPDNLETGILEEIKLENMYRNPGRNYSIWDSVLYGKVKAERNIILLLNCSCNGAETDDGTVLSARGWQLTTYTWHEVKAKIFVDASGDSILASLAGAEYRVGRESNSQYGEGIGPVTPDGKTMGMSCLIQARECPRPQTFIPPGWANRYPRCEDLGPRNHDPNDKHNNYWWLELGGEQDTIHDTEAVRDELLRTCFGVWDHIKNLGSHGSEQWALDWVGFLPGKRESRRCIGDHILTAVDIRAGGRFEDLVAYGGWSMDDHHPGGIAHRGDPTVFHPAPSPYGIPYRSLYSKNIRNLFMAGRNISVTHAALGSTRVMGTCSVIGQAVGTAAFLCIRDGISPREVYQKKISELQNMLMEDDCYLPWHTRLVPALSREAALRTSEGDPEPLRNGIDRRIGGTDNGWTGSAGSWIEYSFASPSTVSLLRFVFDSNLNRELKSRDNLVSDKFADELVIGTATSYPLADDPLAVPPIMVKDFIIQSSSGDGDWRTVARIKGNYTRLVRVPVNLVTKAVRFIPLATWGTEKVHLFSWDVS